MSQIQNFHAKLYSRVFDQLSEILPEFEFKRSGSNWISGNKQRVSGREGSKTGKVYCYRNAPFFLKDYTDERNGRAITKYLEESGKASNHNEAIKFLADRVNLQVPNEFNNDTYRLVNLKAEIFESANAYFLSSLTEGASEKSGVHLVYLKLRGYSDSILARPKLEESSQNNLEFGLIPSQQELLEHLKGKGYSSQDLNEAIKLHPAIGDTHCLTIPCRDSVGQIQGFAFRNIKANDTDSLGKYLYSTGFKKGETLLNLRAINKAKDLIIVEGLIDCLHARALGVDNVVGLGGTSLSEYQVKLAVEYGAQKFTLCLDNDKSGREATKAAIRTIKKVNPDYPVYIAYLPDTIKDPDELIKTKGVEAFKETIDTARECYLYLLDEIFKGFDLNKPINDKFRDELINQVMSLGAEIQNPIDSERFLKEAKGLCRECQITEEAFEEAFRQIKSRQQKERDKKKLLADLETALQQVEQGNEGEALRLMGKAVKQNKGLPNISYSDLLATFDEGLLREALKKEPNAIPSGYRFKNESLDIPSGAITILAAPTNHGKTTFLINLALNLAKNFEIGPVHFFSYEESKENIVIKALNASIGESLTSNNKKTLKEYFKTGRLEYVSQSRVDDFQNKKQDFFRQMGECGRLRIHYTSYTAEDLIEAIYQLHKQNEAGAVFIDYMQLLRLGHNQTNNRQEELKQICLDLKDCAVQTGLPIILGAQFNRTVINKTTVQAVNIREAGDIEHVANLIVGFWNETFEEMGTQEGKIRDQIWAKILKSRDTARGMEENFIFNGNQGVIKNTEFTSAFGRNV